MNKILAWARALWAREPVLLRTGLPELVALGALTAHQAAWINTTVTAVAAVVAQLLAVFGAARARGKVTPVTK